jgi:hypothetical protein
LNVERMKKRASVVILALSGVAVLSGASWEVAMRHRVDRVVPDASHYIQFDRPDVVIGAVWEVVATVRAGAR